MRFNGRGGRAPGEVAAIIVVSTLQLASDARARTKPSIAIGLAQRAASGGDAGVRLVEGGG